MKKISFLFLFILLCLLFLIDIGYGSVKIPLLTTIKVLWSCETDLTSFHTIITQYRIPKALTAILAGIGLSISGLQMQTLFRNPLASPDLLGMGAGASLGVAIVILAKNLLPSFMGLQGQWLMVVAAIVGACVVLLLLLSIAPYLPTTSLLITGLMLTAMIGSLVSLLQYFSKAEALQQYIMWSYGAISHVTWQQLPYLFTTVLVGILVAIALQKQLNGWILGEQYASTLGIDVRKTKILLVLSVAILAGGVTAFCGLISFIAVAVPHIAFYVTKTTNHRILLPFTAILGAILLLLCDILCNLPYTTYILPINIVTAFFGSPLVIWLILKKTS